MLGKNIIVLAEQGVGDEIMFSGCIPDIMKHSPHKLFLECNARLKPLFERSFPSIHIYEKSRAHDFSWINKHVDPDYYIPIGSLPKFFRNSVEQFPKRDSFLVPNLQLVEKWNQRLAELQDGLNIGISWQGGKEKKIIDIKSTTLADWKPLLAMQANFINLQHGDTSKQIAEVCADENIQIHDWEDNDPLKDLDNQAALISTLDLVISVSNATIHLSGAVGTPTWVMLDTNQSWPMMRTFEHSTPLYQSVRLFRKHYQIAWHDVFMKVEAELQKKINPER